MMVLPVPMGFMASELVAVPVAATVAPASTVIVLLLLTSIVFAPMAPKGDWAPMEWFCTVAPLWTTTLAASLTLIPELLPVLTIEPEVTTTAVPAGVVGPVPTVVDWSSPVQVIAWVFVSVVHAAEAGKEAPATSNVAASMATPCVVAVDLAWPRPSSDATAQRASASFQTTRKILFMT
jgi:hypothetical protein